MDPAELWPPDRGEALLRPPKNGDNSRHGYCLDIHRTTGQTCCAYCGVSFVDDYYHWLLVQCDHVVPSEEAKGLRIKPEYFNAIMNLVLCCSGCNGFDNQYHVKQEMAEPRRDWKLEDFVSLRDSVLEDRAKRIAERREQERRFFEDNWERKE